MQKTLIACATNANAGKPLAPIARNSAQHRRETRGGWTLIRNAAFARVVSTNWLDSFNLSTPMKNDPLDAIDKMLGALLAPTVETMRRAGISRLGIDGKTVTLLLTDGHVTTLEIEDPVKKTVGTLVAWSVRDLGQANADTLIKMLHA